MLKDLSKVPIIGIVGGVGPLAGTFFQQLIIKNTIANKDPDHLSVIHVCDSAEITSRPDYLKCIKDPSLPQIKNPGEVMGQIGVGVSEHAKFISRSVILCVPCNTFHANPIFSVYENTIMDYCKENNRL